MVIEVSKDEKLQRKLMLKSFLEHPGYKEFMDEFENLQLGAENHISSVLGESVDAKNLEKLNFNLGVKAGLQRVLYVLEGFKDEIEARG